MKTFARIESGAVAEIVATDKDIATLFHPGLHWMDVTGKTVAVGYVQQSGSFAAPQRHAEPKLPTLAGLQAEIAALAGRLAALEKPCA